MEEVRFTKEMISILSSCKDKKLVSYESETPNEAGGVYGNMRLNFEDFSVEIINEEKTMPLLDNEEDVACISCVRTACSTPFEPMVVTDVACTEIRDTVEAVELITDTIDINDGAYQISFDMAVIFHMKNQVLMVSRDIWFSEMLTISDNEVFDDIFSIENVIESWSNDGDYHVEVKRERKIL